MRVALTGDTMLGRGFARGEETAWIRACFHKACAELGTEVLEEDGRLVISAG